MIALLHLENTRAQAEGYTALRITGEMTWVLQSPPGAERLIEYESKVSHLFAETGAIAICQYNLNTFPPSLLRSVIETHPYVLIGEEVHKNFYYIPPQKLHGAENDSMVVDHWLKNLEAQHWTEKSLRLLEDVALAVNRSHSQNELIHFALEHICALIEWPVGHAYLFDENKDDLVPSDLWYFPEAVQFQRFREVTLQNRFRSGVGLPGIVYATGQPHWVADTHRSTTFVRAAQHKDLGVRAGFAFPVLVGDSVVAVLEFYTTVPTAPDQRLLDLVKHVGAQLGRVIERIRADAALHASEAKFRAVARSAPDAIVLINQDGLVVFWNEAAEKMFGYTADEMAGQLLTFIMPESFRAGHKRGLERLAQGGQPHILGQTLELEGLRRNGSIFPLELSLAAWQTDDAPYYSGILRDISMRKESERQLASERNLLRTLVDTLPDYIYVKDAESRFLLNNSAHLRILGAQSQADVLGKTDKDIFPPHLAAHYRADEQDVIQTRAPLFNREELAVDPAGVQQWVLTTKVPLFDEDGTVSRVVGITRDITDRKQAQEALQQSEARFRAIFDHAAIGVGVVGLDARLLMANAAMCEMLGYSEAELHALHFSDVTHPDDTAITADFLQRLMAGEIDHFRLEKRYLRRDGTILWGRLTCSTVANADGELQFLLTMIEDITEQRSMESNLAEMRRHLARGREAERRHLAHELHDVPMQELYVAQYALQIMINRQQDARALTDLNEIKERLLRVNGLLRTICNELRPPALESFGLDAAIRAHVEEFQSTYPQLKIELALQAINGQIPPETSLVVFRICQQALNNVVKHAEAQSIRVQLQTTPNELNLYVIDDGHGFSLPASWTELTRKGHFGVAGMVERAETVGGSLHIHSQPGRGTSIIVRVPLREDVKSKK